MANSKQAIKRAKQNAETYKLRHAQRSMVRTAVKAVRASIDANDCLLYTSPSPRDIPLSRMPSSA